MLPEKLSPAKKLGTHDKSFWNALFCLSECGGKNFHFVHNSADVDSVVNGTVRSAFEYGGQKCSACSRMYVPQSKWPEIKEGLLNIQKQIKLGSPLEADSFFSAVIDDKVGGRQRKPCSNGCRQADVSLILAGVCENLFCKNCVGGDSQMFLLQAFHRIKSYIDHAKSSANLTVLAGGVCDDR